MMWACSRPVPHWSWNHFSAHKAPHPQLPDVSDVTVTSGFAFRWLCSRDTPFQEAANWCHHSMSERASRFNRTKWWGRLVSLVRSMILRMKDRPYRTTLQACERLPTSDSFLVPPFFPCHCTSSFCSLESLSSGSLSCIATESISMPRNVSLVARPSDLRSSTGGRRPPHRFGASCLRCGRTRLTRVPLYRDEVIHIVIYECCICIIHCNASATAEKMRGADLSPKGSIPRRYLSSGCTGISLYACLMSVFASSEP